MDVAVPYPKVEIVCKRKDVLSTKTTNVSF